MSHDDPLSAAAGDRLPRREALKRLSGLASFGIVLLGGRVGATTKAPTPNKGCGMKAPDGGVFGDRLCGQSAGVGFHTDLDCGQWKPGIGTHADEDCGTSADGTVKWAHPDNDCSTKDVGCGKHNGAGLPHDDADCGKGPEGMKSPDAQCGKVGPKDSFHADANCPVTLSDVICPNEDRPDEPDAACTNGPGEDVP